MRNPDQLRRPHVTLPRLMEQNPAKLYPAPDESSTVGQSWLLEVALQREGHCPSQGFLVKSISERSPD
jgi:hypothetical protein